MDLKNILAYQAEDKKLFDLENELSNDSNKQKCVQLNQTAKASQLKSSQLEEQASLILKEMNDLNKTLEASQKKGEQILALNLEKLSKEELDENLVMKDKVAQNLTVLDKRLTKLAENINAILAEFNRTIKSYNVAKEEYQKFKTAYDKKAAELEPKIAELKKQLEGIKKTVEPKLMQTYLAKRNDRIFPVLVKLEGNTCGRCRMELSASAINKLKQEGTLVCEHCRRIIYFQ